MSLVQKFKNIMGDKLNHTLHPTIKNTTLGELKFIIECANEGISDREIGDILNKNYSTICRYRHRLGITKRK